MPDSDPMDDFARRLLEQFVKAANLSVGVGSLHALDWNHFYDFIIHTHRRQLRFRTRTSRRRCSDTASASRPPARLARTTQGDGFCSSVTTRRCHDRRDRRAQ